MQRFVIIIIHLTTLSKRLHLVFGFCANLCTNQISAATMLVCQIQFNPNIPDFFIDCFELCVFKVIVLSYALGPRV